MGICSSGGVVIPGAKIINYEIIRSKLQTGDLVFIQDECNWCEAQEHKVFSHVGMIVRLSFQYWKTQDMIMLLECSDIFGTIEDLKNNKLKPALRLVTLSSKLASISVRRVGIVPLSGKRTDEFLKLPNKIRKDLENKPDSFEIDASRLASFYEDDFPGKNARYFQDLSCLFSAPLMASVYDRMGILGVKKDYWEFLPLNFTKLAKVKMLLKKPFKFENMILIRVQNEKYAMHFSRLPGPDLQKPTKQGHQVYRYDQIRPQLETGDVLLFSGRTLGGRTIRWFTGSDYSHTGIVVRLHDDKTDTELLCVYESSTNLANLKDVTEGRVKKGVELISLRFTDPAITREKVIKEFAAFREEFKDLPYEKGLIELFKSSYDGILGHNHEDLSSLFCSEIVAEFYKRCGLLAQTKNSNEYTPKDFAASLPSPDLPLTGATLDDPVFFEIEYYNG